MVRQIIVPLNDLPFVYDQMFSGYGLRDTVYRLTHLLTSEVLHICL